MPSLTIAARIRQDARLVVHRPQSRNIQKPKSRGLAIVIIEESSDSFALFDDRWPRPEIISGGTIRRFSNP